MDILIDGKIVPPAPTPVMFRELAKGATFRLTTGRTPMMKTNYFVKYANGSRIAGANAVYLTTGNCSLIDDLTEVVPIDGYFAIRESDAPNHPTVAQMGSF